MEKYEGEDFILLGVTSQEPWSEVDAFITRIGGVDYPVLLDPTGNAYSTYNFPAEEAYAPYPRQFIVDQNGVLQYLAAQYYPDAVEAVIDDLLESNP